MIPGWNNYEREKHLIAMQAFLEWVVNGKNRHGLLFMLMKQSRAQLKLTFRWCKRHEKQIKAGALDKTVNHADPKQLWKAVRNPTVKNMSPCSGVGNVHGMDNVAEM